MYIIWLGDSWEGVAYEELSDSYKAFSDATFEDFGVDDVFWGGLFAFFEVNVFCNDVCEEVSEIAYGRL